MALLEDEENINKLFNLGIKSFGYKNVVDIINSFDVKLIKNQTNMGVSYSRNVGIENSSGNVILCIDADDTIPINYLQENYNNIIEYGVDISYSDFKTFGVEQKYYKWPEYDEFRLRHHPYIHSAAMFKKQVWEKNKFDENISIYKRKTQNNDFASRMEGNWQRKGVDNRQP
jgi:glycosyltransferase involved in cell wall biosynthesis